MLVQAIRVGILGNDDIPAERKEEVTDSQSLVRRQPLLEYADEFDSVVGERYLDKTVKEMTLRSVASLIRNRTLPMSVLRAPPLGERITEEPVVIAELADALMEDGRPQDAREAMMIATLECPDLLYYRPLAQKIKSFISSFSPQEEQIFPARVFELGIAREVARRLKKAVFLLKVTHISRKARNTGWLECAAIRERVFCNFSYVSNLARSGPVMGQQIVGTVKLAPSREEGVFLYKVSRATGLPNMYGTTVTPI